MVINILRRKIGIPFLGDYRSWAGGVIYIINLVSALLTLDDEIKPKIIIFFSPKAPIEDIEAINYPFIEYVKVKDGYNFIQRFINFILIKYFNSSIISATLPHVCYPYWKMMPVGPKPIYWIADFQERYLPAMFSQSEVSQRKQNQCLISKKNAVVVFSSNDARNDYENFYPNHKNELKLLQFASILPKHDNLNIQELLTEFDLSTKYYFSPNQFWKHKNHLVILKAINILKDKNLEFIVAFSGSENDRRNQNYFNELKEYVATNGLEKWVKFLGFIDRKKQLCLMNHSIGIIQPSLFEGWSTVVEDAKALSQFILLSDLRVHREQINQNCDFFDPFEPIQLSKLMELYVGSPPKRLNIDYQQNVKSFANEFLKIVS